MPALRLVAAAVAALAITSCTARFGQPVPTAAHAVPATPASRPAPSSAAPSPSPPPTVTVAGRRIPLPADPTVQAALAAAGVGVPAGTLVAAVSHRPLRSDGQPGRVLRDGQPAQPGDPVLPGDVLTVVPGADQVEPTRTVEVAVAPPNPSALYVGGTSGTARLVVGTLSGEQVSRTVLRAPAPGHLVSPGAVALTFDDGPDPTWTPQVLTLLAQAHVHATFCLIGRQVAAHPDLVRAIVAGGHALCDHTWDHDEHLPSRSPQQIHDEIARAAAAITAASGGIAPRFYRAPGGNWSPAVLAEAARQHLTPLRWTVDPRDWARPGTDSIVATVLAQLRPGGVILLHDGGGDRAQTVAALRTLLRQLPAMGYHFVLPAA